MLDDEDATEKEYHSATIITKRIGRHLFQLVSPFPSHRFITPLTPPRPATTALCQRRLMELGGIPQKWQRVPPPNALLLGSACGAATPLRIHFRLFTGRPQTERLQCPAVDCVRGVVLAARATRGAQHRRSAYPVNNAQAQCTQIARRRPA